MEDQPITALAYKKNKIAIKLLTLSNLELVQF